MQRAEKSPELTRRTLLILAAVSAAFVPEEASAQGMLGAVLRSPIFLRRVVPLAGIGLGIYLLHRLTQDGEARASSSTPATTEEQLLARQLGGDLTLATEIVKFIGPDQTQKVLHGTLGLWCQRDLTGTGLNRLGARISNATEKETAWQLRFAVDDAETKARELEFKSYGYRVKPYASMDVETPIKVDIKPGMKKVSVVGQPDGISFSAIDVLVVPFEIRRSG